MIKAVFPSTHCYVVLVLATLTASAHAMTWECGERSNLPQEGKNYCAAGDFRQSEINLRRVLDPLIEKQKNTHGDAKALTDAQRAFESYRDNQCIAENKRIKNQPFHSMIVSQCKTRHTNLRINELTRMQEKD